MVKPLFCLFTNFFIYDKILNTKEMREIYMNIKQVLEYGTKLLKENGILPVIERNKTA